MKCQKCDKPATFHITDIIDGVPKEVHLCDAHAREYLHQHPAPSLQGAQESQYDETEDEEDSELRHLTDELEASDEDYCACCQQNFLDFRKSGRFGCENDYRIFRERLTPLLIAIHGSAEHTGKRPARYDGSDSGALLVRLRNELADAISIEDYESASKLRDQIKELEERA